MGYVGCVSAACLSRDGHRVVGVDVDLDKVSLLDHGKSPVSEPGLPELVAEQVAAGRLEATSDVEAAVRGSEIALVAVGTPSNPDGEVDTQAVERVVTAIGEALRETERDYCVVIRSTLLPGLLEERVGPALAAASSCRLGERVHLCNNPEFLRETSAICDYDNPPFVLVGADEPATADRVFELYGNISAEHIATDTRTAAMVKYACNAFHALKIDFANEIGTLAGALGADGAEVMDLVCRDRRLNISPAYLRPGFAFGGSCLPKDVRALVRLAQMRAVSTELLSSILPSNAAHFERAVRKVEAAGCRRIGLVGLSFKAGTDDLRESPQVILAETLLGRGYDLKIYDPGVRMVRLVGTNLAYVDRHLPHLAALVVDDERALYKHAELLLLATGVADGLDCRRQYFGQTIDLRSDLCAASPSVAKVK